jgi:peptidyl-prolyl cis-trans isomerase A (cyclophilin A)
MKIRFILFAALCTSAAAWAQTTSQSTQDLPDAPGPTAKFAPPAVPSGPTVVLDTSMGRLTCQLFDQQAPIASANFIGLATGTKDWVDPDTQQRHHGVPFYNGTIFHRVIPGFMIQGGDRTGTGAGDAGYMFKNETYPGLTFSVPGRLAMANAGPDTNGTQFFVTEAPQPSLDGGYTIFGQCDAPSVTVVSAITHVPRNADDKPYQAVTLKKVTIVPQGQPLPPDPMPPAAPAPVAAISPAGATAR